MLYKQKSEEEERKWDFSLWNTAEIPTEKRIYIHLKKIKKKKKR